MAFSDITGKVKSTRPALPQIYAYTTPEIRRHDGWTKIGYTEQDVNVRIVQQTHTADVIAKLEWHGNATYEDTGEVFHDTDFHTYLRHLGINDQPGTEWFEINPPNAKGRFHEFRENHGILDGLGASDYELRAEQEAAISKTLDYFQLHEQGEFLWNAKPRFGKTLATYDLCKRLPTPGKDGKAKRILVVTNRPAIANSWYDDYVKFVGTDSGWRFISSVAGKPYCISHDEYLHLAGKGKLPNSIEFISLQDLKGSIEFGGHYDKLKYVAEYEYDLLVIDEAHEGVDTYKTDMAFDHIKRRNTLHLSGTPFKAIANDKFPENAIYNWTYADEQQAKRDWNDPELRNPYENLPKLNMFTYQMSDIIENEVAKGMQIDGEQTEYAFDLNEFFETKDGRFVHYDDVKRFLDALTTQKKYPFSTPESRDELRHTFWMLNRVDSARALAKMLRQHEVFKDYEIILAAGDGKIDDDEENEKSFDKVRNAIAKAEKGGEGVKTKTITLSVGQLTTGVTVPEWTGVLMLSNMKSPALYVQAAFRAQNPCLFNRNGKYQRKENAYVFDFDPARSLTVFEEYANDLYSGTTCGGGDTDSRKQNVRRLLNFFPVIGEDEDGEMVDLDAEQVLSIPRKIHSREVVRRGFMCDFLFQNISNIFHAPAEVIETLQQLEPYKAPREDLGVKAGTADELNLDENGEVSIPNEQVIGKSKDLFGDKVYGNINNELNSVIDSIVSEKPENPEEDFLADLQKAVGVSVAEPLVEAAKQNYGSDMKASQQKKVERKIKADVNNRINREYGDYNIEKNRIERDRAQALENAGSQAEEEQINQAHDERIEAARLNLIDNLKQSRSEIVQSAGETVVREIETAKKEAQKNSIEDGIRDHLRGFSRTIPSFLMAYGDENTTLESFDSIIPDYVFKDVTSITVDQFRLLRDGGDVTDHETGEKEHFDGHLFDSVVFNDSIVEFIHLRSRLADYFDESHKEDIFDYVPPQKTNQIFTPRKVVVKMIDMLEQENPGCFDDPTHTFADLYMKSGMYITEIIKRLYNSKAMRRYFPDDHIRLAHILEHQVYGIAPTEIIYQIATHYILGYDNELGKGLHTHFAMADSAQLAKEGKLAEFVDKAFEE